MALIDDHSTGIVAGYSTRLLRTAYAGSSLLWRNDDNDESAGIGFSGGWLDESTLQTLSAGDPGGDGFATTLYDQSSNGHNATQASLGLQPSIVVGEAINTLTGDAVGAVARPYPKYAGDYLTATPGGTSTDLTLAVVVKRAGAKSGGTYAPIVMLCTNYTTAGNYLMFLTDYLTNGLTGVGPASLNNIAGIADSNAYLSSTPEQIIITKTAAGVVSFYRRGLLVASVSNAYTVTFASLVLGGWNGGLFNGLIGECLLWNVAKSAADIAAISVDQMTAWGIDNTYGIGESGGGGVFRRIPKLIGA